MSLPSKIYRRLCRAVTVAIVLSLFVQSGLWAATPDDQPPAVAATRDAGPHRKLAPGVLVTIEPEKKVEEEFSRHDVFELLQVNPDWKWAKEVRFAHEPWALELSFKPIRFVWVDVPDGEGKMTRKLIWYMVYRIRNLGEKPRRFIPHVVLYSEDAKRYYPDRLIPVAVPPIVRREDPNRKLLNSVEIEGMIEPTDDPLDDGVWGVATWSDIDPSTDRFSIFIRGLSSAYRWQDEPDGSRRFFRKTLMLNFWRPGDRFDEQESEIRFGAPDEVDYRWVYR